MMLRHCLFLLAFAATIFLSFTVASPFGCFGGEEEKEAKFRCTFVKYHLLSKKYTPTASTDPHDLVRICVAAVAAIRWDLRKEVALGRWSVEKVEAMEKRTNKMQNVDVADMFVSNRGTDFDSCSKFYTEYRLFQKQNGNEVPGENFSTDWEPLARAMGQVADAIFVELFKVASARGGELLEGKVEVGKKRGNEKVLIELDVDLARNEFMNLHRFWLNPARTVAMSAVTVCRDAILAMNLELVEAMNGRKLSREHFKHFSKQMNGFSEEREKLEGFLQCVELYINYRLFQLEQTGQEAPEKLEIASLEKRDVAWMLGKACRVYEGIAGPSQIPGNQIVSVEFENGETQKLQVKFGKKKDDEIGTDEKQEH